MTSYLVDANVNGITSQIGSSRSAVTSAPLWSNALLIVLSIVGVITCIVIAIGCLYTHDHTLWERLVQARTHLAGQPVAESFRETELLVAAK